VAIVTGANRGIGYEIARQLAAAGTTVVATARTNETAREAVDRLHLDGADVYSEALDVTDQVSIDHAVDAVISCHGRIDILVNNAAIAIDTHMPAADPDLD
jgi:NAD(P)-dependent dehydrogenase (short-subunit alcohol dehydrogenase family)